MLSAIELVCKTIYHVVATTKQRILCVTTKQPLLSSTDAAKGPQFRSNDIIQMIGSNNLSHWNGEYHNQMKYPFG